MKFVSLAVAVLAFAVPAFAQTVIFSYDTTYDDPSLPLSAVTCSGLIRKGYTTLGSLPTFPNVGGMWDSPACGTCYEVTYGNTTIAVLAVDISPDGPLEGPSLSEEAMNTLTGEVAAELGRVDLTLTQVDASVCGL